MAEYLNNEKYDDTTKIIIIGLGIAALGFIAYMFYKGACQSQTPYLAAATVQGQCPTCSQSPMILSSPAQYPTELHALEHRLERLEDTKSTSKFDLLEQKLLSLENKVQELVNNVSKSTISKLSPEQESQPDRNIVSMSGAIQPAQPIMTPAEQHTLMRKYFDML